MNNVILSSDNDPKVFVRGIIAKVGDVDGSGDVISEECLQDLARVQPGRLWYYHGTLYCWVEIPSVSAASMPVSIFNAPKE